MAAIVLPPQSLPSLPGLRRTPVPARPTRPTRPTGPTGPTGPASPAGARPMAATYRRRRLVALALLATLLTGLWLAGGAAWSVVAARADAVATADAVPAPEAVAPAPSRVYVVRAGDTLWGIARDLQPEGDIRPLVDLLAERNGGSRLEAGQRLSLDGLVP